MVRPNLGMAGFALALGLVQPVLAQAPRPANPPPVNQGTTPPDCSMHVNFDRNADLPGYRIASGGRDQCLPFMPTNQLVPLGYGPNDFYAREFTDA
ncbi:MAG: hypothetical protein E7K72_25370, partial [Roseomonas mucosa]|nr:hypothetical protein [Roseomonas mucosa]